MNYKSFLQLVLICVISSCSNKETEIVASGDMLGCKANIEDYVLGTRALSDQIEDVNLYYLDLGQTSVYTEYPIATNTLSWIGEYFLFETNKWRTDINCGSETDTVNYYMTATNKTGGRLEPLHGIAPMIGEPLAEFYLKCRKAKLTTIVKMADGSNIDPLLLSLTLNVYPSEAVTDFKSPSINADKTKAMETHALISQKSGTAVATRSKVILLPEQKFEAGDSERPTMTLTYDGTEYIVYLDTIQVNRSVINRYRDAYGDKFALLHNEHIVLTLTLTPIIELVVKASLADWETGTSFDPIAVDKTNHIIYENGSFLIYTAKGLGIFRDIVNGTNTEVVTGYTLSAYPNNLQNAKGELQKSVSLSDYASWVPIGGSGHPYSGLFNGHGHVIANMKIEAPMEEGAGLFGHVSGAQITNLEVKSGSVECLKNGGLLCGISENTYMSCCGISNSKVSGSIQMGGLCGALKSGTKVTACYVKNTNITVSDSIGGGLVGCNEGTQSGIYCSYTQDITVMGTNLPLGGLIGRGNVNAAYCYVKGLTTPVNASSFSGQNGGSINYCVTDNALLPMYGTPSTGLISNSNNGVAEDALYNTIAVDVESLGVSLIEIGIGKELLSPLKIWEKTIPPTLNWEN